MRTRSTTTGSLTSDYHQVFDMTDGVPVGTYIGSYTGSVSTKSITDVVTTGYASLLKCGKFLPLNPVTIVTEREERNAGPWLQQHTESPPTTREGQYWSAVGVLPNMPDIDPDLVDAAILAAASSAVSAQWDVLTFLAELRKTVGAMATIARHFNLKTGEMARTARRYKKNPYRAFQELWLGARYTIRPIIYDYLNATKALQALNEEYEWVRGRGKQVQTFSDEVVTSEPGYVGGMNTTVTNVAIVSGTYTYRGAAYVSLDSAFDKAVQFRWETTAWELLTYSFVVDWFIDIGAWVNTIRAQLKGEYLGVGGSLKREIQLRSTATHVGSGFQYYNGIVGPYGNSRYIEEYTRWPASVPLPVWNPDITMPRVVDLVALFVRGKKGVNRTLSGR